jgi:hypothetical protein
MMLRSVTFFVMSRALKFAMQGAAAKWIMALTCGNLLTYIFYDSAPLPISYGAMPAQRVFISIRSAITLPV